MWVSLVGTDGAVVERLTAALSLAASIPARNKYLYNLQVLHDTGEISSECAIKKEKRTNRDQ